MASATRPRFCALLAVALSACATSDPSSPPLDRPDQLGAFAVGHSSFTAMDEARGDRELPVDVWYPVEHGDAEGSPPTRYPLADPIALESEAAVEGARVSPLPNQTLLVFSHGYGGISTQSIDLMETLASHGFVVISPEHTGNAQGSSDDSFDEAAANRVPDVSFLIDTMFARSRDPQDDFFGRLTEQQVGVLGHSFGGMTAIGMAAGWAGAAPDPRVTAIAPISAVIDAELQSDIRSGPNAGFTAEQLAEVAVPVMLIGGTEDINVPIGNNQLAFEQLLNAPKVYKVDVIGATHTHFANVCDIGNLLLDLGIEQDAWPLLGAEGLLEPYRTTCSPEVFPIEEATRLEILYVVSFFKRQLLNEVEYEQYLTPEYADTEAAIDLSVR
jgi:predicted dienelactone hydrolase